MIATEPKKLLSGGQRAKARAAKGLPRWSERTMERRREVDRRRSRERYERVRSLVDGIKLDRGCADCRYRSHPAALQFDHLPGTEKSFGIAAMLTGRIGADRILAEIEKCEVVCANCHAVREAMRRTTALPVADVETKTTRKLTEADVRSIRASSDPASVIAKRLGVTATNVRLVRRGVTWRDVV